MSVYHKKCIRAFTLAEVLFVLAIIGIIFAITIPSLMNNIHRQDDYARFQKAYSVLSQVTQSINNDCGGSFTNCISNPSAGDNDYASSQEVTNLYKTKLQVAKDCTGTIHTGCFASGTYKQLNSAYDWYYVDNVFFCWGSKLRLNDGSSLCFDWDNWTNNGMSSLFQIEVDINGMQPPNQLGKDLFMFYYDSNLNIIKPYSNNDCNTTSAGTGCAVKILKTGAITYY